MPLLIRLRDGPKLMKPPYMYKMMSGAELNAEIMVHGDSDAHTHTRQMNEVYLSGRILLKCDIFAIETAVFPILQ